MITTCADCTAYSANAHIKSNTRIVKKPLVLYLVFAVMVLATIVPVEVSARGIVVIKSRDVEPYNQALAGFIKACSNDITQYDLGGRKDRQVRIVKKIIAAKPRFILAIGSLAAGVAKDNLKGFPVLYVMVPNPKKYGLEGNNIAGVSLDVPIERQFKTYKSMFSGLRTVGVIYDPDKTAELIREATVVAENLGLQIFALPVSSQKDVPTALRGMIGKVDALWMIPDDTVMTTESFKFFLITTFENSLPFFATSDIFVEVGALASLTPDYSEMGRQSCELAIALTSGKLSFSDINVVPPKKVNLSVNLKTAKKIGLKIPEEIVKSATAVYQ